MTSEGLKERCAQPTVRHGIDCGVGCINARGVDCISKVEGRRLNREVYLDVLEISLIPFT